MNLKWILTSALPFQEMSACLVRKGLSDPVRDHYCNLIQSMCVSCSSVLKQATNPIELFIASMEIKV